MSRHQEKSVVEKLQSLYAAEKEIEKSLRNINQTAQLLVDAEIEKINSKVLDRILPMIQNLPPTMLRNGRAVPVFVSTQLLRRYSRTTVEIYMHISGYSLGHPSIGSLLEMSGDEIIDKAVLMLERQLGTIKEPPPALSPGLVYPSGKMIAANLPINMSRRWESPFGGTEVASCFNWRKATYSAIYWAAPTEDLAEMSRQMKLRDDVVAYVRTNKRSAIFGEPYQEATEGGVYFRFGIKLNPYKPKA